MPSDEQIEKFLSGLCTEEEASRVWDYLQKHPEERYLAEEFEQAEDESPLPEEYKEEMLAVILKNTEKPLLGRHGRLRPLWKWAAAASVILLMGGGWLWQRGRVVKEDGGKSSPVLAAIWVGQHNSGKDKMLLQLPDSSKATLSPGATILYRKDFGHYDKREVRVDGQAMFSVARNREMPFVVYSEGLNTTVLGTVFEVTAEKGSSQIRVRLLEGKVMVGVDSLLRDSTKTPDSVKHYYLSPGEELVYNKENYRIAILQTVKRGGAYAVNRVLHVPTRPDSLANWYMFNNQTLGEVFDQLSAIYNIEIQYSNEDLRHKYFIGKLEKKDSLSKIIRDIALLNHLSVTNQNGRYIIKKQKP